MRYWMLFGLLFSPALWADQVAHYQDQRSAYVAGNLMHLNLDYDSREVTPSGVGLRLGGMVNPYWGVELRAATGRFPFKSPVALPYVENLFVQGFAGIADVKVKTVTRKCNARGCRDDTARNDDTSLAFGAGIGLRTEFNLGLTLEYMQYIDEEYLTVTGIEGGLEWYF